MTKLIWNSRQKRTKKVTSPATVKMSFKNPMINKISLIWKLWNQGKYDKFKRWLFRRRVQCQPAAHQWEYRRNWQHLLMTVWLSKKELTDLPWKFTQIKRKYMEAILKYLIDNKEWIFSDLVFYYWRNHFFNKIYN